MENLFNEFEFEGELYKPLAIVTKSRAEETMKLFRNYGYSNLLWIPKDCKNLDEYICFKRGNNE